SVRFHLPMDISDVCELQDVNGHVLVLMDVDEYDSDDDLLSGGLSREVETDVRF
ncbi:hypothetical protein HYDPIDRAFT_120328, partial [Hydnomerulius pinastri MD-312]